MYKAESVLGLIGSIIATIVAVMSFACCLVAAFFFEYFKPLINEVLSRNQFPFHDNVVALINNAMPGIFIILACVWFVLAAAAFILGYIGTSKLNKNDKNGGVLLIVAGVLSILSLCNIIPFVLFLVGGIMAVSKKQVSASV